MFMGRGILWFLAVGVAAAGVALTLGCATVVKVRPPEPVVEIYGPAPHPGAVWVGGYWGYRGGEWAWVPGAWTRAPRPNSLWVPGRWEARSRGWVWVPGRWEDRQPAGPGPLHRRSP
jgi:hypothetical protein